MGVRISEEKIEQIRKSIDIVDIISEYVQLKKQGRNLIGLCPFHGENTPSFSVSPEKQLYHCFGCKAGGNVFSFIKDIESYTFVEAVKVLADKAKISIPELDESKKSDVPNTRDKFVAGHELATKLYHHLLKNTNQGQSAASYLEKRGFTKEMVETFQIGFAPDAWDTLANFFQSRHISPSEMEQAGLLNRREYDGKYFDRFRNRVMFPIWDKDGKVIGFGGRVLGNEQPKYLNSPDSPLFNKSYILYGFHLARPAIRKKNQAVLFEGYVDVISSWKAGIDNGVATLGTALTNEQAKLIRRNAETVIICYDSDGAGQKATFRSIPILEQAGCYVKVASLPEGLDPDDYIQQYGADSFRNTVIGNSVTTMTFKMNFLRKGLNLNDEGNRMKYIELVLSEISRLPKAIERDHYLRTLSNEFSLSLDALKQELYRIYRQHKNSENRKQVNNDTRRQHIQQKRLLPAFHNAERILLAYMMKDKSVANKIQESIGGNFNIDDYHAIAAHLFRFYGEGNDPDTSHFIQKLADERLAKIATEIALLVVKEEPTDEELSDYLKQITHFPKLAAIEKKDKEKKEAERKGDHALAASIAMEMIKMKKELKH